MEIIIYTDGGSLNNPGRAASAFLINSEGKLIYKEGKYIGIASNNVAEYTALVNALTKLNELKKTGLHFTKVTIFADSQLMINQVNGLYKIKHPDMKYLYMKVKMIESELNVPMVYTHVLREKNAEADALVKQALGQ